MTNEYNEFIEEDLDETIAKRKELIEQAKSLQNSDDANCYQEMTKLQKQWRRISNYDSILDAQLNEEFERITDSVYARRKADYQGNENAKKYLIAEARKLVNPSNWNNATKEIEELMAKWRTIGSAGKETDDALWNEFNTARQNFFDNKHKYWEEMQSKFENARQVKNDLIEKAKGLADSEEWNKTSAAFQDLLDQWKAVGNAGKEFEDKLWNEFNDVRQKFYDRRNQYYDELHEKQGVNAGSKRDLVNKANEIASSKEYTKENTELMKKLSADWKTVGNSGKEEDGLWKEFRAAMDSYFDGLREYNTQRHTEWRKRMQDTRARKQEMIMNQKRQIQRMQEEMASMYSQREIDETEERIQEKKEFIEQLEKEIADIEAKLNQ